MSFNRIRNCALAAVLASSTLGGTVATAQQSGSNQNEKARRVPVTIVLAQVKGDTDAAVAVRRTHGDDADVVALRANASGAQLLAALITLNAHRDVSGDHARKEATIRGRVQASTGAPGIDDMHSADIVRRLPTAPFRDVDGFGKVHAIQVYLPSKQMRDEAKRPKQEK